VDQHLDKVIGLVNIGVQAERIDHLGRHPGFFRDPPVLEETCPVKIRAETLRVPKKDRIRPPAPTRNQRDRCRGGADAGDRGRIRERQIGHNHEERTL